MVLLDELVENYHDQCCYLCGDISCSIYLVTEYNWGIRKRQVLKDIVICESCGDKGRAYEVIIQSCKKKKKECNHIKKITRIANPYAEDDFAYWKCIKI